MDRKLLKLHNLFRGNLIAARKKRGLSQERLALEAEVDRTYVSQIERGLGNPSLTVMYRFAKALDTTVISLLSDNKFL